jgi:hypothetical protein
LSAAQLQVLLIAYDNLHNNLAAGRGEHREGCCLPLDASPPTGYRFVFGREFGPGMAWFSDGADE